MSKIQTQFIQEKTSKSSEYILTNITAKEYMLLKVLTAIIAFVIQIILIIAYYFMGNVINSVINIGKLSVTESQILNVDMGIVKMIGVQIILSITALFIQCLIQSAISSKVGNAKEGSYAMILLLMLNMGVYFYTASYGTAVNISFNINNILCVIPIISTYLLPVMIMYNSVGTTQIVIAILFNLLVIPLAINKCSKVVKNGILGYDAKKGGVKQ